LRKENLQGLSDTSKIKPSFIFCACVKFKYADVKKTHQSKNMNTFKKNSDVSANPNAPLIPDLNQLGFHQDDLELYKTLLKKPHGLILIGGPTGSGKTTTLYSTLNYLQDPLKKLASVENNISARLDGVNQVEVKDLIPKRNQKVTSAQAIRAILKSDPDVIMCDEMRDTETANICIDASLTGHVVLSSVHVNNALDAISRMEKLGQSSFVVAETLTCSIAQRLLPELCPFCKHESVFSEQLFDLNEISASTYKKIVSSNHLGKSVYSQNTQGCEDCAYHGIKKRRSRIPVYEIVAVTPELKEAICDQASRRTLNEIVQRSGQRTLIDHTIDKIFEGKVSYQELTRF
jgi:type IV pilus assembly protein PilB